MTRHVGPWILPTGVGADAIPAVVAKCPSGALHFTRRDGGVAEPTPEDNSIVPAISMMGGVLRPLATTLTTLPAGPPHQGSTAVFTFEVYYVLGNMVPWREPAWALLHERMALLTQRCAEITHGAPQAVHQAHQRAATITANIAVHVPADLRPPPSTVST